MDTSEQESRRRVVQRKCKKVLQYRADFNLVADLRIVNRQRITWPAEQVELNTVEVGCEATTGRLLTGPMIKGADITAFRAIVRGVASIGRHRNRPQTQLRAETAVNARLCYARTE